jgi:hypothetical protein
MCITLYKLWKRETEFFHLITLGEYAPFFALAKINDAETLFCPVGPLSFPGSLLVVGY